MNTLNRTIYPQLVSNYFTSSIPLLSAYTNFLDLTQLYLSQVRTSINYEIVDSQSDFISADSSFFTQLNPNLSAFDNEFIDYWIQKYNNSVIDIKQIVSSSIISNNYFQNYSDSIGILVNSIYVLTESVLPIFDIDMSEYSIPYTYPASVNNKLSDNSTQVNTNLSQKTTYVFRKNIQNILIQNANSTQPHGFNLVTDFQHLVRMQNYLSNLVSVLNNNFDQVFNLVSFYTNLNNNTGYNANSVEYNLQQIQPLSISVSVEGKNQLVDLLGKKIQAVRNSFTIQNILDANSAILTNTPIITSIDTNTTMMITTLPTSLSVPNIPTTPTSKINTQLPPIPQTPPIPQVPQIPYNQPHQPSFQFSDPIATSAATASNTGLSISNLIKGVTTNLTSFYNNIIQALFKSNPDNKY